MALVPWQKNCKIKVEELYKTETKFLFESWWSIFPFWNFDKMFCQRSSISQSWILVIFSKVSIGIDNNYETVGIIGHGQFIMVIWDKNPLFCTDQMFRIKRFGASIQSVFPQISSPAPSWIGSERFESQRVTCTTWFASIKLLQG